jgi:hypothetical protein
LCFINRARSLLDKERQSTRSLLDLQSANRQREAISSNNKNKERKKDELTSFLLPLRHHRQ